MTAAPGPQQPDEVPQWRMTPYWVHGSVGWDVTLPAIPAQPVRDTGEGRR